jgi:DNA-binding GntR family transcriptional regulator
MTGKPSTPGRRPKPAGPAGASRSTASGIGSLTPVTRDNLAGRVYAELRSALMEGRLWPGARLKIRDLAKAIGVSETPVREGVMQLVREGGLEMVAGRAITVANLSLAQYRELRTIRLELEGLAAEMATRHITPARIRELERIHGKLIEAEKSGDWPMAIQANWQFHFGLYQHAAMAELQAMLERIWLRNGPLLNYHYPYAPPTYPGRHQHLNVLDALRARDAAAVRKAIRDDMIEGGSNLERVMEQIEAGTLVIPPEMRGQRSMLASAQRRRRKAG